MELTLASLSNLFSVDALVIGLIALLLFGKNLPSVARNVGRTIAEFKRAANEATSEIKREMDAAAVASEFSDLKNTLRPDYNSGTASTATSAPDTVTPGPRVQPAPNTVSTANYTPRPAPAKTPAVSAAAALDTFRIEVKPPTKIPPPIERS